MNSIIVAALAFALVFGSAAAAMFLRDLLPDHHLSTDSKDAARLGVSLIATMVALVLSLLIASAKDANDARRDHLVQMSADAVLLDRQLALYGPETKESRSLLRSAIAATLQRYWPAGGARQQTMEPSGSPIEELYEKIEALPPGNAAQSLFRDKALTETFDIGRRVALLFGNLQTAIPTPFLVALVFWLCIIFASYGLFAPRNATVVGVLGLCALSASVAIFLILELDRSIGGLLQVSGDPLREALARLGR